MEGGGLPDWAERRLDVVACCKAMGIVPEAVTAYAREHMVFPGYYPSLIKVMSAYEIFALVKWTVVQDMDLVRGSAGIDPSLHESPKEQQATMKALAKEMAG